MFEQHVAITWHNESTWVERLVSDNPITIDVAAAHYVVEHDFNENRDSLEFVDAPETINLDGSADTLGPDDDDVCPESGNGKHLPDWSSASAKWDGDELYVDVNCGNCGASGCIGTSATLAEGINW